MFSKSWKPDGDRCAFSKPADQLHVPPMEFDTAFDHEQAESGARPGSHIASAVERPEQLLLIFPGNADPLVANNAHHVSPVPLNREVNSRPGIRVFHRVAQKICEDVSE